MSENKFANINQYPKHNRRNNKKRNDFKNTQSLKNSSEYNSIQPTSERDSNSRRIRETERRGERENQKIQAINSNSKSTVRKHLDNIAKRIYQWCAQCCGKKKAKLTKVHKSTSDFFKDIKGKCKDRKERKKKTTFREAPVQYESEVGEILRRETPIFEREFEEEEDEKFDDMADKKKAKEKKRKKKRKEKEVVPESAFLPYRKEELVKDRTPDVGIDFTKSCCYLCAQNTMAIAAAMSKVGKFHMSIQVSTKEMLTCDKSCSPTMQVRTVQSSVKVRTRDIGTLSDKKKSKKLRPKLKLKNFNIIPKLKFPVYPKVRTVACETDKSMRHNNIPQCRARRGADCVTN
ncbi:unnamed protein product, partial [Heterotrigona itama]